MAGSAADTGKWQTVKGKQPDIKKKRNSEANLASAARIETSDSVFSALDESYNKRQRQRHVSSSSAEENDLSRVDGKGLASATSDSESSTTESTSQKPQDVPVKSRKPKPKRAKITPSQVASGLNSSTFADLVASVKQTYPDNQLSQLQTLADQLLNAFQSAELPFNKLLSEQPLDKITDIPLQDLPQDVKHILESHVAHLDIHIVSQFVQRLVEAVLETVPEGTTKQPAPKAKVGLLMMLSLLLRSEPAALLLRSQALLSSGKAYSGPHRLPLLLWLINQTVRCNPALAIAIWLRVLLPQILGVQLPDVLQKTAPPAAENTVPVMSTSGVNNSLSYLDTLLSRAHEPPLVQRKNDHGFPEWHGGSTNLGPSHSILHKLAAVGIRYTDADGTSITEPVVPPGALQAVVRTQFSDNSQLQTAQRIKLLKQYEILLELGYRGARGGGFSCSESMRLALDTATLSEGPFEGVGNEVIDQAARNMLSCLAIDSKSADAWETRHKSQLKGSTRVLQHMLHVYPLHFAGASRQGKATVLKLLQALRRRHSNVLATGKGSAKTCAKASEVACKGLQSKLNAGAQNALAALLISLTMVLALVALAYNPEAQQALQAMGSSTTGQSVLSFFETLRKHLTPAAKSLQRLSSPYLQQINTTFVTATQPMCGAFNQIAFYAEDYSSQAVRGLWHLASQVSSQLQHIKTSLAL